MPSPESAVPPVPSTAVPLVEEAAKLAEVYRMLVAPGQVVELPGHRHDLRARFRESDSKGVDPVVGRREGVVGGQACVRVGSREVDRAEVTGIHGARGSDGLDR